MRFFSAFLLAIAVVGCHAPPASAEHPLVEMARKISANASPIVSLNDVAAAKRQLQAVADAENRPEGFPNQNLMALTPLALPLGFDPSVLAFFDETELEARLGFSPFQIDLIGGWGHSGNVAVIIQSSALAGADGSVAAALTSWGHERTDHGGTPVYWRLEDSEHDLDQRSLGPFVGADGVATRFALAGDWLYFARRWGAMSEVLNSAAAPQAHSGMLAIVEAATSIGAYGDLLSIEFSGEQLPLGEALQRTLGVSDKSRFVDLAVRQRRADGGPTVPYFARQAVMLWQDGLSFTGGIALYYSDAMTAARAAEVLMEVLDKTSSILDQGKKIGVLLPADRLARVVQTPMGHVALLTFSVSMPRKGDGGTTRFLNTPFHRLMVLKYRGDLDLLLSGQ